MLLHKDFHGPPCSVFILNLFALGTDGNDPLQSFDLGKGLFQLPGSLFQGLVDIDEIVVGLLQFFNVFKKFCILMVQIGLTGSNGQTCSAPKDEGDDISLEIDGGANEYFLHGGNEAQGT